MESFGGKRVVVMGLGRFGGGVGVTRWLADRGARVLVTDREHAERLGEALAAIDGLVSSGTVTLRLGGHNADDFRAADLVIVNPAVAKPWDNPFVRAAIDAGVALETEIGLVCGLIGRDRVIGVTGSVGKSTTSAMIAHALDACGVGCVLGGNIGGSLLGRATSLDARTAVVLELSSAMLHWLGRGDGWSPRVAVVTNLEANHLDWHEDLDHYRASKQGILRGQHAGDGAVLGFGVAGWATNEGVERVVVGEDGAVDRCAVPGRHNAWNARVAAEAAAMGARLIAGRALDAGRIEDAVRSFPGLPHRLRLVCEANGVRCYDDSKSTVPGATVLAVDAVRGAIGGRSRIHLVCGGYDKKVDLSAISRLGSERVTLYTIGATGDAIAEGAGSFAVRCRELETAVAKAMARAEPGDAVLLSPGCASWDQFAHYEERGRRFEAACRSAGGVAR